MIELMPPRPLRSKKKRIRKKWEKKYLFYPLFQDRNRMLESSLIDFASRRPIVVPIQVYVKDKIVGEVTYTPDAKKTGRYTSSYVPPKPLDKVYLRDIVHNYSPPTPLEDTEFCSRDPKYKEYFYSLEERFLNRSKEDE